MKWSGSNYVRTAAPFLLLALSACSNTTTPQNQPPLLVDSELGRPLANTQRSGDAVLDRERAQAQARPAPKQLHNISKSARSGA
ncbi:type II secretion system protein GspD, partial [Pseudomonas sp. PB103]